MKRKCSWRQVVFTLLIVAFVLQVGFLLAVNVHFYNQASQAVRQSNTQVLKSRAREVTARLSNACERIREMLWTVNEKTELLYGTQMMKLQARVACYDSMTSKILTSNDIDFMFILDNDAESLLLASSSRMLIKEQVAMTQFLKAAGIKGNDIRDSSWSMVQIDEQAFYFKAYQLGKYIIGGLSSAANFDDVLMGEISGIDTGYLLVQNDRKIHHAGYDWSDKLISTENGFVSFDKSISATVYNMKLANVQIVMATKESALNNIWMSTALSVTAISALFLLLLALLMQVMTRLVSRPTRQLLHAIKKIEAGDFEYRIKEEPVSSEFLLLRNSFDNMTQQIMKFKIAEYEQRLQEKEGSLKLLRAQIRPHFYLNAINTVSSMTYQNRNEDIRDYIAVLSKFMRYMLQLQEKTVSLSEELVNVRNYLELQKIRFPNSVAVFVGCDPKIENMQVPYLILFTIVENAFKHAMNLYDTLSVFIQCEQHCTDDFRGFRVIVEDNGEGFPTDVLEKYKGLRESVSQGEHIGLSNVYHTLCLIYDQKNLLHISNISPHGAHVEIWIPLKEVISDENADCR